MFQDIATCLKTFDVAVFDISGHVNLAFRMTKSAFLEVCTIIKLVYIHQTLFHSASFSLYLYLCITTQMYNLAV